MGVSGMVMVRAIRRAKLPCCFPRAAVTNERVLGGSKHKNWRSHISGGHYQESGCWQGRVPLKSSRGSSVLPLLASGGYWLSLACRRITLIFVPVFTWSFSLCVSVCLDLSPYKVITLRVHPNPVWAHSDLTNHIFKDDFQTRSYPWAPKRRMLTYHLWNMVLSPMASNTSSLFLYTRHFTQHFTIIRQAWLGGKRIHLQCRRHRSFGFNAGLGRSPGGGNGSPLQYSCLKNPKDRRTWRATVHGVERVRHDWATDTLKLPLL